MVTQVNMHEAKSQLSALVEKALAGEEVIIARAGKPVVELVPARKQQIKFGLGKGEFEFDEDAFDRASAEIWRAYDPDLMPEWADEYPVGAKLHAEREPDS